MHSFYLLFSIILELEIRGRREIILLLGITDRKFRIRRKMSLSRLMSTSISVGEGSVGFWPRGSELILTQLKNSVNSIQGAISISNG